MNCNFNVDMPKVPFEEIECGECFLYNTIPHIKALYYDYAHEEEYFYGVDLVTGKVVDLFEDDTKVVALEANLSLIV